VDGWLVADQQLPRKQRHTARRIWQRLLRHRRARRRRLRCAYGRGYPRRRRAAWPRSPGRCRGG
jgi:hypothetical protein